MLTDDIKHTIISALHSMKNVYRIKRATNTKESGYWEGNLQEVYSALDWIMEQPVETEKEEGDE